MKIDGCLLTGSCSFRSLAGSETPGALLAKLELDAGVFVSLPSLFYHSPAEGLRQTLNAIASEPSRVNLHGTCHPLMNEMPGDQWPKRIRSVLLAPSLHHYSLHEAKVSVVVHRAEALGFPVVLFRRLGDPRLAPDWLTTREEELDSVREWIENAPQCRLVLSQFFPHELQTLLPYIAARPDVYIELGGFGGAEGTFLELLKRSDFSRWIYGSGAPLHYYQGLRNSLVTAVEEAGFPVGRFAESAKECYGI